MRRWREGLSPSSEFHQEGPGFIEVHFPLGIGAQGFLRWGADIFLPVGVHGKGTRKSDTQDTVHVPSIYSLLALRTVLAEMTGICTPEPLLPYAPDTVDWKRGGHFSKPS